MSTAEENQMDPKGQNETLVGGAGAEDGNDTGDEKIPASAVTPGTTPPSPPADSSFPLPEESSFPPPDGSSSSPPSTAPPPAEPPPSPPPAPPTSPPPSSPPRSLPFKSPPPASPPAPAAPREQNPETIPTLDAKTIPLSPPNSVPSPPPPFSPDSGTAISFPPLEPTSFPPPPGPQTQNLPKSPFHAPILPTSLGSAFRPPSSTTPSPPVSSSASPSGNSNQTLGNNAENGNNINNNSSYQEKTMIGIGIATVVIITFIAVFFGFRKRKKRAARHANHQYMPPPNFTAHSDGSYYGQKPDKGNSGQTDPRQNLQQNSSGSSGGQKAAGTMDSTVIRSSKTLFTYEELTQITGGFSGKNIIGEGGFGCVYKAILSDGKAVAVKQLKAGGGQRDRDFKAEVEIISRVHHRHLVSLVGYCISERHRLLIYEFVPNKTLEHHLHGKCTSVLDWAKRVKIAIGAAKGLAYLHEDCNPKIIHRDIKSANILLEEDFEAQVADFGLARLNDTTHTHVSTRVMGTFGYLAPEYASSGKLTDRSDVFSFGVVLLELITGRKPVDQSRPLGEESLVEWARPLLICAIETGDISELVDPRLEKHYVEKEVYRMIEMAASCVRHSAPKRPRMVQVVRALDSAINMSDLNNGVKVGYSTAYDSGQYSQDIKKFRRMTHTSDEFSDSAAYNGDNTSYDYTSHESEKPFNHHRFR